MPSLVSYGFLAPPAVFILLCLTGAVLVLVWRRLGIIIVLASSLCLFVAATPAFSSYLTRQVESEIPNNAVLDSAEAIVVLGADVQSADGPMPDRLGPLSLERLVLAADAYRRLRLPVVVSGGPTDGPETSVAELMKAALERYFSVPVALIENRSRTTYENALHTGRLLQAQHVTTIILVTQARDLPRAIWSFERVGLRALPWPAPRTPLKVDGISDFLPNMGALHESSYALHELLGGIYYSFALNGIGGRMAAAPPSLQLNRGIDG
jgi:uncharacterized SAM-binding protein YcdF (DUF218 family)